MLSTEAEGFKIPDPPTRGAPVACALPSRKEIHAVLAPLLRRSPSPRSRTSSCERNGHRAPGAQARGEGAAAAGEAPLVAPPRPDPVGGSEPGAAEGPVVLVRGPARDVAPVAPGAHQ